MTTNLPALPQQNWPRFTLALTRGQYNLYLKVENTRRLGSMLAHLNSANLVYWNTLEAIQAGHVVHLIGNGFVEQLEPWPVPFGKVKPVCFKQIFTGLHYDVAKILDAGQILGPSIFDLSDMACSSFDYYLYVMKHLLSRKAEGLYLSREEEALPMLSLA